MNKQVTQETDELQAQLTSIFVHPEDSIMKIQVFINTDTNNLWTTITIGQNYIHIIYDAQNSTFQVEKNLIEDGASLHLNHIKIPVQQKITEYLNHV